MSKMYPALQRTDHVRQIVLQVGAIGAGSPTDFEESAHLSSDGTFDMYEIMLALYFDHFFIWAAPESRIPCPRFPAHYKLPFY